jgi:hypothetical protein
MKTITNYITERIRVDNIKSAMFPINGTFDDVVVFLEEHGFKNLGIRPPTAEKIFQQFEESTGKVFMYDRDANWIRFADNEDGKISKRNPIYTIFFNQDIYTTQTSAFGYGYTKRDSKDVFGKLLNKRFGF